MFFTFETFKVVKNGPFFKQKLSRADAYGKKIEGALALAPALGRYCETEGTHEVHPGRGRKEGPQALHLISYPEKSRHRKSSNEG